MSRNLSCSTSRCTVCKWQCQVWAGVRAQHTEPHIFSSQSPALTPAGRGLPPAAAVIGSSAFEVHLQQVCTSASRFKASTCCARLLYALL